jgi:zeaxanthin glucosyltransferase
VHFGILSPPVSGHLHPFGALGRELIARGHQVTLLHMADLEPRARKEGLSFIVLGQSSHPPGTLPQSLATLGKLDGLAALRFTIKEVAATTRMMLRDGPAAICHAGIEALLVDQTEPAGAAIAGRLRIPFVTVCNALALNREPEIPPPFTGWNYRPASWARLRNRFGYMLSDRTLKPVRNVVAEYRRQSGLPASRGPEDSFSPLLQISQQAQAFDFPRRQLPRTFHYLGPLRSAPVEPIPFPWNKVDGRPLVYASLGTLQNGKERIFRAFAEACLNFPVQLVITHGGGLDEATAASFPGKPLVVSYAPQLEVLARARLTLTHAGLNTVLDSLTFGVPLVAVPITYEQPAIARRISWSGVGRVVAFRSLSVARLRDAIGEILSDNSYTTRAQIVQRSIQASGGVTRAAELIETALAGSIRPNKKM